MKMRHISMGCGHLHKAHRINIIKKVISPLKRMTLSVSVFLSLFAGTIHAAMTKVLNDGDLSAEDASMVGNLLKQSSSYLTPLGLTESVGHLAKACTVFDL
jgi:hypothetical protein